MKVLIAISGIDPFSGGPTRSCKGLCRALSQAGVDVTLYVLHEHHPFEDACGVRVVYASDVPLKHFISLFLPDLVHLQGLWDPGLHRIAKVCRKAHIPYIISPRGMLDPWALSVKRLKKQMALALYQHRDLNGASAFHVTAQAEADHIRDFGLKQPCIIVPNAVDFPVEMPPKKHGADRVAIFMGRLHPGKGLLMLADVWAKIHPTGWRMKVVGPDAYGHKKNIVSKLEALVIRNSWDFVDALNDSDKWFAYRGADILIHPSVSENFGVTIAEGLAAELPVICTKGTPWQELESHNCGWWTEISEEGIEKALREAMALSDGERAEMGQRGRELVKEKYTWDAVAKTINQGYEEIIHG